MRSRYTRPVVIQQYDNHQITAVDMHAENLDSDQLICYPLLSKGEVRWQNK